MINLLPYSRRVFLKSLYKKRLVVVGLLAVTIALLPLVFVLGLFSYMGYQDMNTLNQQYSSFVSLQETGDTKDLFEQVQTANDSIKFFKDNLKSIPPITKNIEKFLLLRPADIRITAMDFSKSDKGDVLNISGISGTRDSIIKYSEILDVKNSGPCKTVSVPVDTYTKKIELPFTITCNINYEAK